MSANEILMQDIKEVYNSQFLNWADYKNKTFFITGATGGIAQFLINSLMYANKQDNLNIKIIACVRNKQKAKNIFKNILKENNFKIVVKDIEKTIKQIGKVNYVFHCANNTDSSSFVNKPVETFNIAINGTKNVLEFAKEKNVDGFVFLSSMEVYGDIKEEKELTEEETGNVELLNERNSYPIGKRTAESLCYAYYKEYGLPVKVARLSQVVNPNVDYNDNRIFAYLSRCIVEKKDIVLKTTGNTTRSFCYISDAISGLLTILSKGKNGEVYNISNEKASTKIKDLAERLTNKYKESKLIFDIQETNIYPKEIHWILASNKLKTLGWNPTVDEETMYERVVNHFMRTRR